MSLKKDWIITSEFASAEEKKSIISGFLKFELRSHVLLCVQMWKIST
jgi:hypothetical protein